MEITMKGFTLKELSSVVNPFTTEARFGEQVCRQTETETEETEVRKYFEETKTLIFLSSRKNETK